MMKCDLRTASAYKCVLLLFLVMLGWSMMLQSAERPSTLPSANQCQTLLQQPAIKTEITGWCLIIVRNKGNCLACHHVDITPWPVGLPTSGNIAPPLAEIAKQFPNKIDLKNIIYDAVSKNPQTVMPLFGKHEMLSEPEIDRIVEFLMTL